MATAEGIEADEDEFTGPPPPPRGTTAYRRLILSICARDGSDAFQEQVQAAWQHVGWRIGLDVMTTMLERLSLRVMRGDKMRDTFGHVRLERVIRSFTEEEKLHYAADTAAREFPELPRHEAFTLALEGGEAVWGAQESGMAVWQQALNALEAADLDHAPAMAILLRHYNTQDDRMSAIALGANVLHGALRMFVLPPGDDWVDDALRLPRDTPDIVTGSLAFYQGADLETQRRLLPDWMESAAHEETEQRRRRKKGYKGCPHCGGPH